MWNSTRWLTFLVAIVSLPCLGASEIDYDQDGDVDAGDLARAAQNPIASMISLPLQNNTNFNFGPEEKTQNILNIQPVAPVSLNADWNLITRTIVPVVSQPKSSPADDRTNGLGDSTFTAFLSPKDSGKLIWGVGQVLLLPTATDDDLGVDKWGLGPSAVFLTMQGPSVAGSLFGHVWSVGGSGDEDVNLFTWQYFITNNLPDVGYLTTSPIITANWEASSKDTWPVPVGGGFGKIFRIGEQPMNAQLQAFSNVEKPEFGVDWTLQFQL